MRQPVLFLLLVGLLAVAMPRRAAAQALDAAALASHRTVAVLPFETTLQRLRLRDFRAVGPDTAALTQQQVQQRWVAEQQPETRLVAYQMQELVYAQLLKQQPKHGYRVQFQPVAETNRRLLAAGITYDNIWGQSPGRIQQALGVDAVLSGQVLLVQPLPKGLGLAARVLLHEPLVLRDQPSAIAPSQTTACLTLDDCRTGQLTWRFDFARTGDNALKPERLAPRLVREALPVFPYCQP